MRLGVIEFGQPFSQIAPLLSDLRERGVDVIVRLDEPPQSPRDEAERLHRADCDGVFVSIGDGVNLDDIAEAMLFIHTPLLLVDRIAESESDPVVLTEANAIVFALAVALDSVQPSALSADFIESWLRENVRSGRQKGIEAAHKLYGARLYAQGLDAELSFPLKLRWLQQFGVSIRTEPATGPAHQADFSADDGSLLGALAQRLLCLVSGLPEAIRIQRSQLRPEPLLADQVTLTVLLLSTARASDSGSGLDWSFYARIFRGIEVGEGAYAVGATPFAFLESDRDPEAALFYAVPGDFVGAIRAALNTLDIPTVVLRNEL